MLADILQMPLIKKDPLSDEEVDKLILVYQNSD
jgi:hypothetical protein